MADTYIDGVRIADLSELVLDGRTLDVALSGRVTKVGLRRTIDGASTLTITCRDKDLTIQKSGILESAVDLVFDTLWFRLVADASDAEGNLTLTFESRVVAYLRRHTKPRSMSRADVTAAQFLLALVREVKVQKIPFVSPELDVRQQIAEADTTSGGAGPVDSKASRDYLRKKGLADGVKLKLGGKQVNSDQVRNMSTVLGAADRLDAGPKATFALVEACIVEAAGYRYPSGQVSLPFSNPPGGTGTSKGILQLLATTAASHGVDPMNVQACAEEFLKAGFTGKGGAIRLAKEHPDWSPGQVAQAVQGSAFPSRYEDHRAEADAVVGAYGSGGADSIPSDGTQETYTGQYRFQRNADYDPTTGQPPESTWDTGVRIAKERNWRWFESGSTIYYVSDEELMRSRPRMVITPETDGLMTTPTHTRDVGIPTQTVELDIRAVTWAAPPGSVILLDEFGTAKDGRWLVQEVRRDDVTKTATHITLTRAQKANLEPAAQEKTRQANDSASAGAQSGAARVIGTHVSGGTLRDRIVAVAKKSAQLSAGDPSYYHYSQHGAWKYDPFKRSRGEGIDRDDCSSWIISVYDKAGAQLPAAMKGQGFTGTLADNAKRTAGPQPGDICLYGTYPYHHVELYIGEKSAKYPNGRTIGHGSDPVDYDTPTGGVAGFAGYFTPNFLNEED